MSWTDEKNIFMRYCEEHKNAVFEEIHTDAESYWEKRARSKPFISEYGFHTPAEMMECMQYYLESEELRKIITVGAFKKFAGQTDRQKDTADDRDENKSLPEYVYNF